jgi:ribosomal protein S21
MQQARIKEEANRKRSEAARHGQLDGCDVVVDARGLDSALKQLKREVEACGILKALRIRRSYPAPGQRARCKRRRATIRFLKKQSKAAAREGGDFGKGNSRSNNRHSRIQKGDEDARIKTG